MPHKQCQRLLYAPFHLVLWPTEPNEKQDGKKSRHDPARTVHGQAVLRSIFQFYKYGAVKD